MDVVVLNINIIFDESRRGIALTQKLQNAGREWQQKLQALEEQGQRLTAQRSAGGKKMAPHQSLALQADIEGIQMEMQYIKQRSEAALKAHIHQSQTQILQEVGPIVEEYRKSKNHKLILIVPATAIIAMDPACDVTADFIRYYDTKFSG